MKHRLLEETEKLINNILDEGIQSSNLDYLDKLVDIHKDVKEEESMRYMDYGRGSYGRDAYGRRSRDSRGRYTGHESEGAMEDMYGNYMAYSDSREEYNRRGNYGAKEDSIKSLEYMLECMVDFVKMLKEEAGSQEELNLIDKYTKKVSEM